VTVSTSCPDACMIAAADAGRFSPSLTCTGSGESGAVPRGRGRHRRRRPGLRPGRLRVFDGDLLRGQAGGEIVKDDADGRAGPGDDGLACITSGLEEITASWSDVTVLLCSDRRLEAKAIGRASRWQSGFTEVGDRAGGA
jgi:hypothetical protein